LLTPACIIVLGAAAVETSWRVERADGLSPVSSQLAVLRTAASGTRPVAVIYTPLALTAPTAVTGLIRLKAAGVVGTATDTWLWFPAVPAGRYRLDLENQVRDASLTVSLSIGRESQPIVTWTFENLEVGPVRQEFELPVDVRSISIRGQTVPPRAFSDIWLEPVALSPTSGRPASPHATAARRYGNGVVFGLGEDVYLEPPGIWTAAEADAEIVIVSAEGQPEQKILLRAGPVRTSIGLDAGNWRQTIILDPGQTREIAIPVVAGGGGTRVRVHTDQGFRPSDTDPRSTDTRYLGVWIELR
jgi:hypothetical protein